VAQEFYAVDDSQNEDCDLKKYDNLKDSCLNIKKVNAVYSRYVFLTNK